MTSISANASTILIVDSEQDICNWLSALLDCEGYTVNVLHSGEDALATCEQGYRPDLVIIADALPGMNGQTTCCRLKALPDCADLLVLLLTDNPIDNSTVDRIFAAGVADYTVKPLHPRLVLRRVRWLIESKNMYASWQGREHYETISNLAGVYAYEVYVTSNNQPIPVWSAKGLRAVAGDELSDFPLDKWQQLIHPDDMAVVQHHRDALMCGKQHMAEFRICAKDGQIRWLRNHGYPVVDDATGRVTYLYGVVQDMTHFKQSEEMFRQQALELQARNEDLDAFAYSVAHDLKNPISSMMGFASLVKRYYDRMSDEALLEYLDLIMVEGYQLKEMINALLVLAGVSKMREVEFTTLDMPALVENVERRLTMMIDETAAKIITPAMWPEAAGYAPWVEEIWMNYISNAVKYGGRPPIVTLGGTVESDTAVRFWVQDNGEGLTLEQQRHVFTPFTRLNQVKVEGHGLGLSVVQRIVERMGGTVGVQSEVGVGSMFSFTLPTPG